MAKPLPGKIMHLALKMVLLLGISCGCQQKADPFSTSIEIVGPILSDTTWHADQKYILTGQATVEPGVVLTIEAGTTIKAIVSDVSGLAPVLVVKPGARIIADGTATQPITFTSAVDSSMFPARGLWGGVIIMGRAPVNIPAERRFVEGVAGLLYGGDDPDDSSGILRYVRVWYGGRNIGTNNGINGFTFAGVGRGTTLEYLESAWNKEAGFKFFGGTVGVKHLSSLFSRGNAFDTVLGYNGRLQHLFALLAKDKSSRGFEMDNNCDILKGESRVCTYDKQNSSPRSFPRVCNATIIGPGTKVSPPERNDKGLPKTTQGDVLVHLRSGTGGDFRNLVAINGPGYGLRLNDQRTFELLTQDIPDPALEDSLYFSRNNVLYNAALGVLHLSIDPQKPTEYVLPFTFSITNSDPLLGNTSLDQNERGIIDPRPTAESPLLSAADACLNDGWFDATSYVGAFSAEQNWLASWSWLAEQGMLP